MYFDRFGDYPFTWFIFGDMEIKPRPNHRLYIKTLRSMTSEQRLAKAFELSELAKELFFQGLQKRFPLKSEAEIRALYLERIAKCYNRNY
jgi:hypothetical protein